MFKCHGLLYLIISSGFTPTNAETQTWPAVTGLAASLPLTPPPSPPHHKMRVRYQTQWCFSWQLGWSGGKTSFLSAEDFKSFWLGCVLGYIPKIPYHNRFELLTLQMKLSEQVFPASVFDGTQFCHWMLWQVRLNHGLRSMRQLVKQREQN